jgi:hypothetical protein
MAGRNVIKILVPHKTGVTADTPPRPQLEISRLKASIDLTDETSAAFNITDPQNNTQKFGPFSPGSPPSALVPFPSPPTLTTFNSVTITPPVLQGNSGDPARRRYVLWFYLNADYNINGCASTMGGDQTWTIAIDQGPPAGPNILGACVQSLDENAKGAECTATVRPVPLSEPVARVLNGGVPIAGCADLRPGLDAILVLDKSGSMAGSTMGNVQQSKIDALHKAVTDFVYTWVILRQAEAHQQPPIVNTDNIGVTLFDATAQWWPPLTAPGHLNDLSSTSVQGTFIGPQQQVDTITPGSSTSIGNGLLQAASVFNVADSSRRRVILLMSNGMQNTDQMVGVFNGPVVTYSQNTPNATTPLPNQSNYQIYAVTVGTSTAVNAKINQDLATATKGFYINTEDDASQMSPFFLELLQNFVKFNTWETTRLTHSAVTSTTPYSTTIPISTTARHVAFSLRWPDRMPQLRLSVTPPGEAPTERIGTSSILLDFNVPTSPAYTFIGDWQVRIEVADIIITLDAAVSAAPAGIPFDLTVLSDDEALESEMSIVTKDYVPGDQIRFEARVSELGQLVRGLGSHPGDRMVVQAVKPGVGIGDLLSTSTASTTQPFPVDPSSVADAKLFNQLQQNPQSLVRDASDVITLVEEADGIYRGSYGVQKPGHYNFLFGLEGITKSTGRFSRQQLKTVYVRPAPDATVTSFQINVQKLPNGGQLAITMTPRTKLGDRLGPGWANYFWFTAPGLPAFKALDNLDGTFIAKALFTSILPPPVSVHFLNVSLVIGDSVTADHLPLPLDDSTVFVKSLVPPGGFVGSERLFIGFFSHGGVASVESFPDRFVSLLDNYPYKQGEVTYEYYLRSTRLPDAGFVQGQRNPPDDADSGSGPGNLFLLLWNVDDSTGRVSLQTSYSVQREEEREETRTHDGCVKVYAVCQRGEAERHARVYYIEAPNMDPNVVRQIQQALSHRGVDPGPIDGDYGPKTAKAVFDFQAAHGLVANGEVGPQTALALGIQL